MATISPVWTEDVTGTASSSVAAGASTLAAIDLDALGADLAEAQVVVRFNNAGNPDGDALVEVFDSVNSGGRLDSEAVQSFTIELTTGSTKARTIAIVSPYSQVKATNQDSSADMTLAIRYAWRQWNST